MRSLRPGWWNSGYQPGHREPMLSLGSWVPGHPLSLPVRPEHPGRNVILSPGRAAVNMKRTKARARQERSAELLTLLSIFKESPRGGHRATQNERLIPLSFKQKNISSPLSYVQGAAMKTQQ